MIRKNILIPVLTLLVVGGSVLSVGYVNAQGEENPASTLVTKISQKFNLNESEVQAVFDEARDEKKTEMKSNFENRLNQAVADGKITESQKTVIMEKFGNPSENKVGREDFKNMTMEERKTKMEGKRTEMENWATQNGISSDVLKDVLGGNRGIKGAPGHFRMR